MIRQTLERIAVVANAAGTLVVLTLVLVVNYDIIMRNFYDSPFIGAVEVVQFSLVLIVFLQLPDVVRVNRLTRSDGFLLLTGTRWPGFSKILRRLIDSLSAVFMAMAAFAIYPSFIEMWESKDFFGVPGVFTAPWWPLKLVILLSTSLCAMIFVIKVIYGQHLANALSSPTNPKPENS